MDMTNDEVIGRLAEIAMYLNTCPDWDWDNRADYVPFSMSQAERDYFHI